MKKSELRSIIREIVLNEIGEGVKPYPYHKVESSKTSSSYEFTTDAGVKYEAFFELKDKRQVLYVEFSIINEQGRVIQNITFKQNPRELFRVMSTVKDIIEKEFMRDKTVKIIKFSSAKGKTDNHNSLKGSEQRKNIYLQYIKKSFPDADHMMLGGEHVVFLDRK